MPPIARALRIVPRSLVAASAAIALHAGASAAHAGGCVVTCPANQTTLVSPSTACSAVVNYPAPTTSGGCGTITCNPPSGSSFGVGTTTATCTDSGGASCTFAITVNDNAPPVLTCPANVSATIFRPETGIVLSYPPPTVSDNCSTSLSTLCTPPSGSFFPVGTTTATCTTSDGFGNTGTCQFALEVGLGSVTAIPALDRAGMVVLAVVLAGAAMVLVRRRG
jgi:hypothetical protein